MKATMGTKRPYFINRLFLFRVAGNPLATTKGYVRFARRSPEPSYKPAIPVRIDRRAIRIGNRVSLITFSLLTKLFTTNVSRSYPT